MIIDESTVIVWRVGDPKPRVWTSTGLDNPLLHVPWSWSYWGRKIVKSYWVTK